jgi:hypothetical protein
VDSIPSIEEGATSTMGGSTGIFTNEMLLERYMLKLHLYTQIHRCIAPNAICYGSHHLVVITLILVLIILNR